MILGVRANRKEFNSVKFSSGFNIVLAERTKESTKKDTRNGLGKTTLLNIIHFCLGAKTKRNEGLLAKELEGWTFHLDLLIRHKRITVSRSVDEVGSVVVDADANWLDQVLELNPDRKPKQAKLEFDDEIKQERLKIEKRLKIEEWRALLGWGLYDLPAQEKSKYSPTFRSLISYDIRRDQFNDPFKQYPQQSTWSIQVNNAYLLDLNWEHAQKWQFLRNKKKNVDTIKRVIRDGNDLLANILGTVGELENERDRLQRLVEKTDEDLRQFRVHPQYEQIESKANELTRQLHDLSNRIIQIKRLIDFHDASAENERPADDSKVIEIYEEAGTTLPHLVKKQLDEVKEFHIQITQNREAYLRSEVNRLQEELNNAKRAQKQLSNERAEQMKILETHGALEEYNELQRLNLERHTSLEAINKQIEQSKKIDRETSEIRIEREQLYLDARSDFEERSTIKRARKIFNDNSEALYEAPGDFIIDLDSNSGHKFRVDIKRSGSDGISKMKVLCYDLMRAELWSQREASPRLLIHDSTIFADVDERQIARALELGERKSRECGFQYIVCLNSDKIPWDELSKDLDIKDYVRLTLTDDKPAGSILGIRF